MKTAKYKMMNKTWLLTILICASFAFTASAQPGKWADKREKIEALKVAFITQELSLTPKEAQQFWPVYNQMEDELKAVRKAKWANRVQAGTQLNFDKMSDEEIEYAINKDLDASAQEIAIRRKYFAEFKNVLPMRKVGLLYRAEERFKMKLLNELKKKQEGNQ